MAEGSWYYSQGGQQAGPVSTDALPAGPPPLPPPEPAVPAASAARASRARLRLAAVAVVAVAGGAVLFRHDPARSGGYFPPCPFHALTGLHCPGCGSTRSLHQLLHGRLAAAFAYNPLLVLALPFVAFALARDAAEIAFAARPPLRRKVLTPALCWAIAAVVAAYWVLRNVPAFSFLAPHAMGGE